MLLFVCALLSVSVLPVRDDPVLFGQPAHAHEVHDPPQVRVANKANQCQRWRRVYLLIMLL